MKKINITKIIFYLTYIMLVSYYLCVRVYVFSKIRHFIYLLTIFMLIILFIVQSKKYNLKTILLFIMCAATFFTSYIISDNSDLLLTVLFIIVSKNIDINEFIKIDYYIKIIFFLLITSLCGLGFAEMVIKYRFNGAARYALGFGHPNVLGAVLLSICIDLAFIKYKKMKLYDYGIFLISFIICTFVCNSRAAQLGIIILVLLSCIMPIVEKKKFIVNIIPYIPITLFVVSYLLAILYNSGNRFAIMIDYLSTTRVRCCADFINYYGINLLGHHLEYYGLWDQQSYLTVLDNSYINILIQFGIIPLIIIIISLFLLLKKSIKRNNYNIVVCIVSLLLYGLMENYSYMIGYSSILACVSYIIYEKKDIQNNDIKNRT